MPRIDLTLDQPPALELPFPRPDSLPGKVEKVRTYQLAPGMAHLYDEGDLHSPRRDAETRLIRIEGVDLTQVKRDKFEIAA